MAATSAAGTTCLVTGATSGIGAEIVATLAADGHDVVAVARNDERARRAAAQLSARVPDATVEWLTADLSVLSEVRSLAAQVLARRDRLDVLMLNAGVARPRRELTSEGFEVDFVTNHLSGWLLTSLLTDRLRASTPSRVIAVSSSTHRGVKALELDALPTGESFHQTRTYAATKLLNVLFTAELSRRLEGSGVVANAADPGFVRTALGRDSSGLMGVFLRRLARPIQDPVAKGAATPLFLATAPETAAVTGGYFAKCAAVPPSALAQDEAVAGQLWELSARLADAGRPG